MSDIIKAKKGKVYLQTPEGLELLGETAHEGDVTLVPNTKYLPALFFPLTRVCKHHTYSYDEDRQVVDACHHPNNTPSGCSWGDCRLDVCPVWRKEAQPNE